MTDDLTQYSQPQPGVYDDDRLLACALGLDEDPELLEAAAGDAALAGRLAALRSDVAAIERRVGDAVPAPDDGYADLGGERWTGLHEYFEPPHAAGSRGRASRWLRVAVPLAAVVVVALAVGLVAVNRGDGPMSLNGSVPSAVTESSTVGSGDAAARVNDPVTFTDQLDAFAVVVLAKARAASGAVQRFAVVRVFKGKAPEMLELNVGERPADRGRLHLLLLQPLAVIDAEGFGAQQSQGSATTKGIAGGPGHALQVVYTYNGEPAVARELPRGTDPQSVALP